VPAVARDAAFVELKPAVCVLCNEGIVRGEHNELTLGGARKESKKKEKNKIKKPK